jgi:hypothetical protein
MFVCRGGFNKQYHIVGDEALTFYQLFNFLNMLLQEALSASACCKPGSHNRRSLSI